MPHNPITRKQMDSQRWMTFVRNHAKAVLACDFFIAVTASFRILHVLVIREIGTWRIVHFNVTDHPTAECTHQQFREGVQETRDMRFLIHDRDCIYSADLDLSMESTGIKILKTPVRAPTANAFCERLIGTFRRECLDFMIPLNDMHLRRILKE